MKCVNMKFVVSILVGLFIVVNGLYATTFYVADSGSDANAGTLALPWRTLTYASSIISAGDTVYVKAGLYNENVVFAKSGVAGSPIVFQGYKTTPGDAPPLLVNNINPYSNFLATDMPTFDGGNRASGIGFNCQNRQYLVIKNFQIRNYAYGLVAGGTSQGAGNLILYNVNTMFTGNITASYAGYGILFGSMGTRFSNNNTVIYCQVVNSSAEGLSINGNYNQVTGCKVYCNENTANASTDYYMIVTGNYNHYDSCYIERAQGLTHNGHGYTAKTNAEQVVDEGLSLPAIPSQYNVFKYCVAKNMGESFCVRHRTAQYNLFYHCKAIGTHTGAVNSPGGEGNGIAIRDGASDNIFDGCVAENCRSAIRFNDTVEDGDTGTNPPGHPGNNNRIINGIFINCYAGINFNDYSIPSDAGDNTVANCTFFKTRYLHIASRSCKNMKYINNVYYGTLATAAGGDFKSGDFANDIVANSTATYFSNCNFYNIEGGLPVNFLTAAVNCISADPLFKNAGSADLHLQATSPCLNTGKALDFVKTDFDSLPRPQGTAYEMGAYEYRSATGPPDPPAGRFVSVYPNPVSGILNVITDNPGCQITIFDLPGREIYRTRSVSLKTEIGLQGITNGIYFIRIKNRESEKTEVVIKMR